MENPRVKFRIFVTLSWEKTVPIHENMEDEVCDNFHIDTCTNILVFDLNAVRYAEILKIAYYFAFERKIYKNQHRK